MALSAFDDKAVPPGDRTLAKTLGRASRLWTQLTSGLRAEYGPLIEEWNFSGMAYGWSCRLKQKKRTIVYMTPCRGHFFAGFALGEKACLAARSAGLTPAVMEIVSTAPKYPEGRGVRIPVRSRKDVECVEKLAALKMET